MERPIEPRLIALTVHAREVSSETREAFAGAAKAGPDDPRAILVHTCHRVELYAVDDELPDRPGLALPPLPIGGRRLEGREVVRHVLGLAAGLDSVVVGEDQILHQLRESLGERQLARVEAARALDFAGADPGPGIHPVLQRLLQVALHLGREVRSQRDGPPRSLADHALDRLAGSIGPLGGRRLLIVGAGRMARSTAMAAARQDAHVLIANRSHDRAVALARVVGGEAPANAWTAPPTDVEAVLLAISGRWPMTASASTALAGQRTPVVDLSSPPAIDPGLRAELDGRYTSVDDLAIGAQEEPRRRLRQRSERAIVGSEAGFLQWLQARSSVPTIQALSDQAELRRRDELERLFRRGDLDAHQRELVEQMSRRLVAGLLHSPLVVLGEDPDGDLDRAARSLFSL